MAGTEKEVSLQDTGKYEHAPLCMSVQYSTLNWQGKILKTGREGAAASALE